MKIAICASMSALEDMLIAKEKLEALGHVVEVPAGISRQGLSGRSGSSGKSGEKAKHDLIRKHYEVIKGSDAILVVNPDRNGIRGYIGGNTFLEMGFAFILNKRIFCLNALPELPYASEIAGMQPVVLNGNLDLVASL